MAAAVQPNVQLTEADLFARLEQLERAVYVPVVSGEVTQWLGAVVERIRDVVTTTGEYYRTTHPQLYRQISELDPEQSARVQMLDEEDERIYDSLRALLELAEKLHGAGDYAEPDEGRMAVATKELSDRVIANVLRIRRHETEVSTWHVEALLRDRGAAD